jgi:ornithine cyclodeaminase/alanine dehydrogenase-like protein (mu-crystallin family)
VTLYLRESDVASLLSAADAVPVIEESFRRLAAGEVDLAPRRRLEMERGRLALMGAADRGLGLAGSKNYAATL